MRRSLIILVLVALVAGPASAAPPGNDDPKHALVVDTFPATIEADTSEATTGRNEDECFGAVLVAAEVHTPANAVWYRLNLPEEAEQVRILHSARNASVVLWSLDALVAGEPVLSKRGCVRPDDPFPYYAGFGPMYMSVGAPVTNDVAPVSIRIDVIEPTAIANDVPYRATKITSLPFEAQQETWGATYEDDSWGCSIGAFVWYSFTPTGAASLEISVSSDGVYSAATVAAYSLGEEVSTLGCGGDFESGEASIEVPVESGVPVLIGIGTEGSLTLRVRTVGESGSSPDARAGALPLAFGSTFAFDTSGATLESGEPTTCGSGGSVWFSLPSRARTAEVSFTGAVAVATVTGDAVLGCSESGTLTIPDGSAATHLQVRSSSAQTGTIALGYDPAYGKQLTDASPFTDGCGDQSDTPYVGSEVEVSQVVDPHDPDHILVTWQQDRYPDHGGAQGIGAATSFDGGETWTNSVVPGISVCNGGLFMRATDPWGAIDADGTAYIMSLGYNPGPNDLTNLSNSVLISRSEDGGLTWGAPIIVAVSPGILFNDKETLTADPNTPGLLYAVWNLYPTSVALPVFARSEDGGRTWTPPIPLPTSGGGSGAQIAVLDDGTLVEINGGTSTTSRDRGNTWSLPTEFGSGSGPEGPPDVRGGAYIPSVSTDGVSVFVTWSDTYATFFARSDDAGSSWFVRMIGGELDYPRRFTTAVTAADSGTLAVMTYMIDETFRSWLALATSDDGGQTWSEQPVTETFDMARAPHSFGRGYFLGDYFGLSAAGGDHVIAAYAAVPPGTDEGVSNVYWLRLTV